MADIELVVKIPEEIRLALINNIQLSLEQQSILDSYIKHAIINGTPLPKGHGKLKDFDKIEWYGCDFEGRGCIEAKGNCSFCNHANCYAKQVRELPTIIEADEAESEDSK